MYALGEKVVYRRTSLRALHRHARDLADAFPVDTSARPRMFSLLLSSIFKVEKSLQSFLACALDIWDFCCFRGKVVRFSRGGRVYAELTSFRLFFLCFLSAELRVRNISGIQIRTPLMLSAIE